MKAQLETIKTTAVAEIAAAETSLEEIRIKYLGKKGALTAILRGMGSLTPEERPIIGAIANEVRACIEEALEIRGAELKKQALAKSLADEKLDVTYSPVASAAGHIHPITAALKRFAKN